MVQESIKMWYSELKPRGTDVLCKLHNQHFMPVINFLMNTVLPMGRSADKANLQYF